MVRDYSKAKIYKIIDNTNGNIYIGSTLKALSNRLAKHRTHHKEYLNGQCRYKASIKILENGDYNIALICNYPECKNIDELRAKERYYIEIMDCVNKNIDIIDYVNKNKNKNKNKNIPYKTSQNNIKTIQECQKSLCLRID